MQKKAAFLVFVLVGPVLTIQGCGAAIRAGTGTVAYIRGSLQTVESENLDSVYEATEKAIDQLELNVSQKTKDAMSALIVTRDSQDKKIKIKLSATAGGATKLSIQVGAFGNETKSRLIYEQIKKNLM